MEKLEFSTVLLPPERGILRRFAICGGFLYVGGFATKAQILGTSHLEWKNFSTQTEDPLKRSSVPGPALLSAKQKKQRKCSISPVIATVLPQELEHSPAAGRPHRPFPF